MLLPAAVAQTVAQRCWQLLFPPALYNWNKMAEVNLISKKFQKNKRRPEASLNTHRNLFVIWFQSVAYFLNVPPIQPEHLSLIYLLSRAENIHTSYNRKSHAVVQNLVSL